MALPNFRIETLESQSGTTIKLAGELDSATCQELTSRVENVLSSAAPAELVLDLSEISFIDSSGLRAIILAQRDAGERGAELRIVAPPEPVTELLHVTGLTDLVELAPRSTSAPSIEPFIERIELELPRELMAPARARAELRDAFRGRLGESEVATITLLTSELVTNAVIHPDPGIDETIGLRIVAYPDRVRVEVSDAGSGFDPRSLAPRPRETGGHGLVVVGGLSSRWGIERSGTAGAERFCVWFELDAQYDMSGAVGEEPTEEQSVAAAEGA